MWRSKSSVAQHQVVESTLDLDYPVSVRRSSRRRSIELRITRGSLVRILCPLGLTDTQIADFVRAREAWIQSKLSLNKKRAETPVPQFEHGSCWQYRGRTVSLELSLGSNSVVLESDRLRVQSRKMGVRYLRTVLKDWFIREAETLLTNRTQHFADCLGVEPSKIQLRQYRAMWGRCNSRHEIAYDWRIIMAPDSVVDYLVIHELCHLAHFDHSPHFWRLVRSLQPTYQKSVAWLRSNAHWIKQTFEGY